MASVGSSLRAAGYPAVARTLYADPSDDPAYTVGVPTDYQTLGPGNDPGRQYEPPRMPGIIVEGLFVSNPEDNQALRRPAVRQTLARGLLAAVEGYFAVVPG